MKVFQMICLFFSCKIQNTCYNGSGCNKLFRVECHIISFDPRDNVVISLSWPYKNLINLVKHTNDFPPKADLSFSSIIPQWWPLIVSSMTSVNESATPLHTINTICTSFRLETSQNGFILKYFIIKAVYFMFLLPLIVLSFVSQRWIFSTRRLLFLLCSLPLRMWVLRVGNVFPWFLPESNLYQEVSKEADLSSPSLLTLASSP